MPQFDVHRRAGRAPASATYYVTVQSSRFDRLPTRIAIPLIPARFAVAGENRVLPLVEVEQNSYLINALQILSVPLSWLGPVVASLADDADASRIIAAIDEAISRGYR